MANMFEKATDLDPQPEFPIRTQPIYYQQLDQIMDQQEQIGADMASSVVAPAHTTTEFSGPPVATLLMLWIFGLMVWCMYFINSKESSDTSQTRRKKGGSIDV